MQISKISLISFNKSFIAVVLAPGVFKTGPKMNTLTALRLPKGKTLK